MVKRSKWVLENEWLFQILVHKGNTRIRVVASNIDRRDRVFARGLTGMIRARLMRARAG